MKRIKMMIFLLLICFLTGCADKLKCQIRTNNYDSNLSIIYKDGKPLEYNFEDKMKFSPTDLNGEIYFHEKYEEYSAMISEKLATVRNYHGKISTKIDYNFEADNSDFEKKLIINKDDSKENAVKKIESLGYKCK